MKGKAFAQLEKAIQKKTSLRMRKKNTLQMKIPTENSSLKHAVQYQKTQTK